MFLKPCHVASAIGDLREHFSRRFLLPYIDIGMDVHEVGNEFVIGGRVALSTPGEHCLWCMGILDRQSIADEVRRYGAAGGGPRSYGRTGILASTAVGLFVQLVAPWHEHPISTAYLEYDGNSHTLKPGNRLAVLAGRRCSHFHPADRGGTRGRIGERAFFTAYVPLFVSCAAAPN